MRTTPGGRCELPLCESTCGGGPLQGTCGCVAKPGASVGYTPSRYMSEPLLQCAGDSWDRGCYCRSGFLGEECDVTCPSINSSQPCGGAAQGSCVTSILDTNGTLTYNVGCQCEPGWEGEHCTVPACPGIVSRADGMLVSCSGRGSCVRSVESLQGSASNGTSARKVATCACNAGFGGDDCTLLVCPSARSDAVCSGYGACELSSDGRTSECKCVFGWAGADCNTNAGLQSLIFSLPIGLGLLVLVIAIGLALYCMRARRAGRFLSPGESYRRRRWQSSGRSALGSAVVVHVPRREKPFSGSRTRINPDFY